MNKPEFIAVVSEKTGLSRKDTERVINAALDTITASILAIVEDGSDDDGWMFIGDVGNQLAKRYQDFDVRNFGFKKLSVFLEALHAFEIRKTKASGNRNIQLVYIRAKEI